MQRRDFLGLMGATALSIPRPGYVQAKADMPLVGFLLVQKLETSVAKDRIAVLRKGLQEEGFIDHGSDRAMMPSCSCFARRVKKISSNPQSWINSDARAAMPMPWLLCMGLFSTF